jgi:hypothetical protein
MWRGLRIGSRKPALPPVPAHFLLLVAQNAQRGAWLAGAKQYEARFAILGIVTYRVRLIDFATVQQTSCASQTASLVAQGRQLYARRQGGVPNMLVRTYRDRSLSIGHHQDDRKNRGLRIHQAILREQPILLPGTKSRQEKIGRKLTGCRTSRFCCRARGQVRRGGSARKELPSHHALLLTAR